MSQANSSMWWSANMRKTIVCLPVLLLSACGFHLRGHEPMPAAYHRLAVVYATPYSALNRDLTAALKVAGVTILPAVSQHFPVLHIVAFNQNQQVLSNNGGTALSQVLLRYQLTWFISRGDGRVIIPQQTVTAEQVTAQSGNLLDSSSAQAERIYDGLRQSAIVQMLLVIEAHAVALVSGKQKVSA